MAVITPVLDSETIMPENINKIAIYITTLFLGNWPIMYMANGNVRHKQAASPAGLSKFPETVKSRSKKE